ncbi:SDR family oxidoreductase [Mycobacterium sp. shizuoka-1]|uniref:SDR family oxidoreductase n=1 Tax=Mycobacterium sp. shizuoka-1 TaxID=2039281 RepID=UPI000C05EAB8|nr:SDR family oxidoreductase [Mycobacterium sp. shizuoka-1]GAY17377.1 oxidoreductase [Mycobacterium sp. shizuoka-1]
MGRRRAILVGVEGGIGHAIAHALAADGCDLGLTWFRDELEATRTATELKSIDSSAVLARLDLGAPEAAAEVIADLTRRLGGLDVLVCSAGYNERPQPGAEFASLRRVVEINLIGMSAVLLAGAAALAEQGTGGRIVVVTSAHENIPLRDALGYTAAKHGLGGLTKGLALELAPHGITVNSVAPGPIATRMTGHEGEDATLLPHNGVPAGRHGAPAEVAAVVRFLASAEASYVTGSRYSVDGGMALMAQPARPVTAPNRIDRALRSVTRSRKR